MALLSASTAPLSGTVPNTLANAQNVKTLQLARSKVSGTLPSYLEQAPNMFNVYFTDSDISGTLPNLTASNIIYELAFKGISVSGTLPASYKRFAPCLSLWVYETPVSPPHAMHSPYKPQRMPLTWKERPQHCQLIQQLHLICLICVCGAGEWHPTKRVLQYYQYQANLSLWSKVQWKSAS